MKLVEQLMRENFKQLKAKEDAEDVSRRRLQNDALIQKELLKKAQELHQTSQRAINNIHKNKLASRGGKAAAKNGQANSGAQIRLAIERGMAQTAGAKNYKKQRSKSCMNKTDNIFGAHIQRSKERQQQLQNPAQISN
jgi:hypothetical protein